MSVKRLADHPVICLSSQNWAADLWTNKQHLMHRLAKRGQQVLYVCKGMLSLWGFLWASVSKDKRFFGKGISRESETLFLAHSGPLPLFGLWDKSMHYERFGYKLDRLRPIFSKMQERGEVPVVWAYHPGYGHYLDKIPKPYYLLYDCVDDYASFPGNKKKQAWVRDGEAKLMAAADFVTTTSQALYDDKRKLHNNVHYVHNVGDFDHFNLVETKSFSVPDRLADITGPKVAFFGALSAFKVDVRLLEAVVASMPAVTFCLMGPMGSGDNAKQFLGLKALSNVRFLGEVAYADLPQYISAMDALMIPYAINTHTTRVFPIKFFECLATGKPLVMTPLPSCKAYYSVAAVSDDALGFKEKLQAVLAADSESAKSERLALAKQHDWSSRLDKIIAVIEGRVSAE